MSSSTIPDPPSDSGTRTASDPGSFASLVASSARGDAGARHAAFDTLYGELHEIARRVLRGKSHAILQTTLLVHEGYLRLFGQPLESADGVRWNDHDHLLHLMARAMRRALIDAIREDRRLKAGGGRMQESLDPNDDRVAAEDGWVHDALAVDEALEELARRHPNLARIEECRIFGGFTIPETARILSVSQNTVKKARAYLKRLVGR